MRQALNENPMVQLAVLGIGAVVIAFLLFTNVLKKDEPAAEAPAAAATDPAAAGVAGADPAPAATAPPADGAPPASGAPPADGAPPAEGTPPAEGGAAVPSSNGELKATKGLPKDVLAAYSDGKAVVLVVIDPKAEGNARLVAATRRQAGSDVAVFVVDVNDIADYSRITEGVSVSRAPALVVVRPRRLSDGVPTASVTYGFLGPQSLRQAIDGAFYDGGTVPAYP